MNSNESTNTVMWGYWGLPIDLSDPRPEDITLGDIAHHLFHLNRFNGAAAEPIPVLMHSVFVFRITKLLIPNPSDRTLLFALLHDAEEAYVGDLTSPVKNMLGESYRRLVLPVRRAVFIRFIYPDWNLNLCPDIPEEVHTADMIAREFERREYMSFDHRWPLQDYRTIGLDTSDKELGQMFSECDYDPDEFEALVVKYLPPNVPH